MTLREANKEIELIENDIEKLLRDKEAKFIKTQPQAVDPSKQVTQGGKRIDKFLAYAKFSTEKEIDEKLDELYKRKKNWENWVEKKLKILNKYDDLEKQIIYYKEIHISRNSFEKTWHFISKQVHASESTCRRIYRKYKNQRYIEN